MIAVFRNRLKHMQTHLDFLKHITRFVISVALIPIVGKLMFQKHIAKWNASFKNFQLGATTYGESVNAC